MSSLGGKNKHAFSLMELLIVVLIVGVVYTLALSNFQNIKKGKIKPTLLTLERNLGDIKHDKEVKLICIDNCDSCFVQVDGVLDKNASKLFEGFIDSSVKVYHFDPNTGFNEIQQAVYFNKENVSQDICFSLAVDKQRISDQVVVEYKDKVYDFTTYFEPTKVYASTSEMMDAKQKIINEVIQ